ncbi:hypothetical protein ACH5RR_025695 [Cinchona calisaya]|uniref:Uncharacterized protein n=1 Tax=Cinchona calisaya TaxID=153742 RepID=A0ABD2Z1H4_9GENT
MPSRDLIRLVEVINQSIHHFVLYCKHFPSDVQVLIVEKILSTLRTRKRLVIVLVIFLEEIVKLRLHDSKTVFDPFGDSAPSLRVAAAAQDLSTIVFYLPTTTLHLVTIAQSQLRPVRTKAFPPMQISTATATPAALELNASSLDAPVVDHFFGKDNLTAHLVTSLVQVGKDNPTTTPKSPSFVHSIEVLGYEVGTSVEGFATAPFLRSHATTGDKVERTSRAPNSKLILD